LAAKQKGCKLTISVKMAFSYQGTSYKGATPFFHQIGNLLFKFICISCSKERRRRKKKDLNQTIILG
jgi:hypothetical protein